MDIELEQTSIYILLSVFAAQLHDEYSSMIVHQDDDYFLFARRMNCPDLVYAIEIWRTCEFESKEGALFNVASFPGVIGVKHEYRDWHAVPVNQQCTRMVYGAMHGIIAAFAYPNDEYELLSFCERAGESH